MKKLYSILIFSICLSVCAQPSVVWQKLIGGSGFEAATNILQTADGGFITIATTSSNDFDIVGNHGSWDIVVMKFNASGIITWKKCYGGPGNEHAASIQKTTDGGYIICGTTDAVGGDVTVCHGYHDIWVFKITGTGILVWEKSFGGTNYDEGGSIEQTTDGGYIISGSSQSIEFNGCGPNSCWLAKLTATGVIEWQRCFATRVEGMYAYSSSGGAATKIIQTADGGYLLTAATLPDPIHSIVDDFWVVKFDGSGVIEWEKRFGGSRDDRSFSVIQTTAGDYVIIGNIQSANGDVTNAYTDGFTYDGWIVKISSTGNLLWQKVVGGTKWEFLQSIQETSDGGYIVCGATDSTDGNVGEHIGDIGSLDAWLIKISDTGNMEWNKLLGGLYTDQAIGCIQNTDGDYILCGTSNSVNGDLSNNHGCCGTTDIWIAKVTPPNLELPKNTIEQKAIVFPNPAKDFITLSLTMATKDLPYCIYDQSGKTVLSGKLQGKNTEIDIKGLQQGIYVIKAGTSIETKFVKQ